MKLFKVSLPQNFGVEDYYVLASSKEEAITAVKEKYRYLQNEKLTAEELDTSKKGVIATSQYAE